MYHISPYGFMVIDEFETNYNGVSVFANRMIRDISCT